MPRLGKKTRTGRTASAAETRTLHSRPPLSRFQEIFHAIKTGRYPNRTKLAETIEVTTKTIQRDIDYMRYQMSVPIEFDFARGGYCFTKPMADLPLFQLTEAELVSVFVAQKALEAYQGTVLEQPLRTAFQKLQAATGTANVSVSWEDFDSAISFRHFDAYLPDATVFSELAKAIRNEEIVEFGYKKLDAKLTKNARLNPGTWLAFRASGICSGTTGLARRAGSSCSPGCGKSRQLARGFPIQGRARGRFNGSSGTAFKSGKPKTPSSSKSFCDFPARRRSSFGSGTGMRASRSRS